MSEAIPRKAGQFSLHHTLCVHRSAPNNPPQRPVGLGINYIPAHVGPTGARRMPALLVRGTDRYGHFDLYEAASGGAGRDGARERTTASTTPTQRTTASRSAGTRKSSPRQLSLSSRHSSGAS